MISRRILHVTMDKIVRHDERLWVSREEERVSNSRGSQISLGTGHECWKELNRNDDYCFSFFCLAHLARAAFLALALLSSALSLAARLFPPFEPPNSRLLETK